MRFSKAGGRQAAVALVVCALLASGCAQLDLRLPRIDPTGERIFAEPLFSSQPSSVQPPVSTGDSLRGADRVSVVVCPCETVAPVGGEVIVLAGVLAADHYLRTNERVEWLLEPGGVGQFVDLGKRSAADLLVCDFTRPRKIDNTFAIGSTARREVRLTRGTPTPDDDVVVQPGQAWISVTSPIEGSSRVTAYAPSVADWECRKQTATIHWVDAQWSFPPPSINPAGTRHVLTTTVTRTNGSPCAGWRVRYEILDGPAAGFAPDGVKSVEVLTNDLGQASAEILQPQPAAGTNRIAIQIIRPAELGGGKPLVVGSGVTLKTWSAADLAVRKTGPAVAGLGATVTYQIEVTNPGDLPAENVVLGDAVPEGLSYVGSEPAGEASGRSVRWQLGTLAARETRSVRIDFRAERQGSVTNCAEASAAGGLQAKDCAATTVSAAAVEVQITGPQQAVAVGQEVAFTIVVTNRGPVPVAGLVLKDSFDPGLEHAAAPSPIERDLGVVLAPGQSQQIGVGLRVTKAGQLCNTVEVLSDARPRQVLATARACITAVEGAGPKPPPGPAPGAAPTPQPKAAPGGAVSVSVTMSGPESAAVGDEALFTMTVTNTGQQPLSSVKIAASFDAALRPIEATDGHVREGEAIVWTLPTLTASDARTFQVKCVCQTPVSAASGRVRVTSREGATGDGLAAVRIQAAPTAPPVTPPKLSITVSALREPVSLNKEVTYVVQVTNAGQMPDRQVRVVVTLPPELQLIKFATHGPAGTDFDVIGQSIRFTPVPTLAPDPNRPLEYRVRVRAVQTGTVRVRAELSSESLPQPIAQEATTSIFLPP